MASQLLTLDADLSPLQWLQGDGADHYLLLNNVAQSKNVYALGPDTIDTISISDPTGVDNIGLLTFMRLVIKNVSVSANNIGGTLGVKYEIYKSDGTLLGWNTTVWSHNTSPHQLTRFVGLQMYGKRYGAESINLYLRMTTYEPGGTFPPWDPGLASIVTYQIIPTLIYNIPITTIGEDTVWAPVPVIRVVKAKIPQEEAVAAHVPATRVVRATVPQLQVVRAPIDPTRVS